MPKGEVEVKDKRIRVQAIKMGYRGLERIRPGRVFYIASERDFSKLWMRRLKEGEVPPPLEPEEFTLTKMTRGQASGDQELVI